MENGSCENNKLTDFL